MIFEKNDKLDIIKYSFLIFLTPILILFLIKIYTFVISFNLYVTSGAEITTLNFLYNFLNKNNLLDVQKNNILYEFYGLNFHLIYFPFVKLLGFFKIHYLFSSRIFTLLLVFILPIILIKIGEKISFKKSFFINHKKILYLIILAFLINHQSSSWWIITYRPDIVAITLSFLSVLFFFNFIENKKNSSFFISILLCVISWTLKQNFLFTHCSIFLYLLYKKNFYHLSLYILLVPLFIFILNILTDYNNLDLLNRSPNTLIDNFEIHNYFSILSKYLLKNPYLVFLVFITSIGLVKKINDKKIFYMLIIFFLFFQSSFGAILHSAGFNHLMVFSFFSLSCLSFIELKDLKKFYLFISFFLIISSSLNYFQLLNYNILGRQGLFFNKDEKREMLQFKSFISNKIKKPASILGASNRTEIFLLEEILGKDTFQITSYLDPSWKAFIWRTKKDLDLYDQIFIKKFDQINTVIILEDIKNKDFLLNFLKNKNFRYKDDYFINVYENNFKFLDMLMINKFNNDNKLLIKKKFLVYEKIIF